MKTNWRAIRIGCLTLVSGVISSPLLAQTQDGSVAPGTASVISSVAITQASERSSVRVEGEGPLTVRAARMQDPDRLVLDFSEARFAVHKTFIPGVSAPVRGVRLGQYRPNVARVVIDLTAASPYQILREGATVVVSFDLASNSPVHARAQATSFAEDTPNARPAFWRRRRNKRKSAKSPAACLKARPRRVTSSKMKNINSEVRCPVCFSLTWRSRPSPLRSASSTAGRTTPKFISSPTRLTSGGA